MKTIGILVLVSALASAQAAEDDDGYENLSKPPPGTRRVFLGFKLTRVEPGSLYEKVGLREGDLLKSMNGKTVTSPEDLKQLPVILERDRKVELKVDRGEKHLTLRYTIKTVRTPAPQQPRKAASTKPKKPVPKKKKPRQS